jgi:tRNA pseudouridine38-40 synthase
VEVVGNACRHNRVRIVVGTLVEVGRGNRPQAGVAEALAACDRRAAGPTAPAKGLVFERVTYAPGLLIPWQ